MRKHKPHTPEVAAFFAKPSKSSLSRGRNSDRAARLHGLTSWSS
jgi:hypothetical protein